MSAINYEIRSLETDSIGFVACEVKFFFPQREPIFIEREAGNDYFCLASVELEQKDLTAGTKLKKWLERKGITDQGNIKMGDNYAARRVLRSEVEKYIEENKSCVKQ